MPCAAASSAANAAPPLRAQTNTRSKPRSGSSASACARACVPAPKTASTRASAGASASVATAVAAAVRRRVSSFASSVASGRPVLAENRGDHELEPAVDAGVGLGAEDAAAGQGRPHRADHQRPALVLHGGPAARQHRALAPAVLDEGLMQRGDGIGQVQGGADLGFGDQLHGRLVGRKRVLLVDCIGLPAAQARRPAPAQTGEEGRTIFGIRTCSVPPGSTGGRWRRASAVRVRCSGTARGSGWSGWSR